MTEKAPWQMRYGEWVEETDAFRKVKYAGSWVSPSVNARRRTGNKAVYAEARAAYRRIIETALSGGEQVPLEILAECRKLEV